MWTLSFVVVVALARAPGMCQVRVVTDEELKKFFHFSSFGDDAGYDEWMALAYLRSSSYTDMFNAVSARVYCVVPVCVRAFCQSVLLRVVVVVVVFGCVVTHCCRITRSSIIVCCY